MLNCLLLQLHLRCVCSRSLPASVVRHWLLGQTDVAITHCSLARSMPASERRYGPLRRPSEIGSQVMALEAAAAEAAGDLGNQRQRKQRRQRTSSENRETPVNTENEQQKQGTSGMKWELVAETGNHQQKGRTGIRKRGSKTRNQ